MNKVGDLPHDYTLASEEGKGLRKAHLIAVVRPDGTPANISSEPPPSFPTNWLTGRLYGAIMTDLRLQGQEGGRLDAQ